jgi:hypothetical protein
MLITCSRRDGTEGGLLTMGMVPRFDIRQGFQNSEHVIIAAFGHLIEQAQEAQRGWRHDGIFGVFALCGEEHRHLDTEQLGEVVETASGDAINAVFVFLNLAAANASAFAPRALRAY